MILGGIRLHPAGRTRLAAFDRGTVARVVLVETPGKADAAKIGPGFHRLATSAASELSLGTFFAVVEFVMVTGSFVLAKTEVPTFGTGYAECGIFFVVEVAAGTRLAFQLSRHVIERSGLTFFAYRGLAGVIGNGFAI